MTDAQRKETQFINTRNESEDDSAVQFFMNRQADQLWQGGQQVSPTPAPAAPEQPATGDEPSVIGDVAKQAVGGVRDAIQEGLDSIDEFGEYMTTKTGFGGVVFGGENGPVEFLGADEYNRRDLANEFIDPFESKLPDVEKPATMAGGFTRGVTQFLTGFVPVFRALKGTKALTIAQAGRRAVGAGAVTDFTFFDPHEERLSNFIEQYPHLSNPITQYLSASPYDSSVEGRMKNVLEGLGLDAALAGVFTAVMRTYRSARNLRKMPVDEIESAALAGARQGEAEAATQLLSRPPSTLTREEFDTVQANLPEGQAPQDFNTVLVDALETGKPIAKDTLDHPDYARLRDGINNPQNADDITLNTMKAQGLVDDAGALTERGKRVQAGTLAPNSYVEFGGTKFAPPEQPHNIVGDANSPLVQRPNDLRNLSDAGGDLSTSAKLSSDGAQSLPSQVTTSAPPSSVFAKATAEPSTLRTATPSTNSLGIDSPPYSVTLHNTDDVVKLFEQANKSLPELEKHLEWVVSDVPTAKIIGVRVKDEAKALSKIEIKGKNPAELSDYLGARVSAGDENDLNLLLSKLDAGSDIIDIEDFRQNPKAGYRAVHVQIKNSDGFSSEVQILPEPIARVQEQAHELYERFRRIDRSKLTPEELAEVESAERQSVEIFDRAWKEWEDKNLAISEEQARAFLPVDAPAGNRALNINLARLQTSDDIKDVIAETADQFKSEIKEATRGVQSNQLTSELADHLGMTPQDLLNRRQGQAFNAEEALAARQILASSADRIVKMARMIEKGEVDPDSMYRFRHALQTHKAIQMQVSGLTAEAGRALQAFRIEAKTRRQQLRAIDELLDQSGGNTVSRGIAESLVKIADEGASPAYLSAMAGKMQRVTSLDTLLTLRQAALLSSYKTHIVNIVSNTITMTGGIPERFLAGAITTLRGGDGVALREGTEMARGLVGGFWDAVNIAARSFRENVEIDLATKTPEYRFNTISAGNLAENNIGKGISGISKLAGGKALGDGGFADHVINGLGHLVDLPFRALGAEDAFFKHLNARMELQAQAYRQAEKEGLKGDKLTARVSELISNPPDEMLDEAVKYARVQTFTNANRTAAAIQTALNNVKIARFVIPFIRTPTNLIKYSFDRTPLALVFRDVREDIAAGGSRRALAEARIGLGTTVMVAAGSLAAGGKITGSAPSDPRLRAIWMQENQPYSYWDGTKWNSYNRLDPWGTVLGMGADLWQIAGAADEGNLEEMASLAVLSMTNQVLNKTWMTGLSDFLEAVNDPERRGPKYFDYMMSSFVPALSRQLNYDLNDPVIRDFDGTWQGMLSRVPGFSDTLPAKRDIWGGMRIYSGGVMMQELEPANDPTNDFLIRRQIPIGMPPRSMSFAGKRVRLTPEEYSRYVELARQPAKEELDRILPQLELMDGIGPETQLDVAVKKVLQSHAATARSKLLNEFPEIRDRALYSLE